MENEKSPETKKKACYVCGKFFPINALEDDMCYLCIDEEDIQNLMDRDRE